MENGQGNTKINPDIHDQNNSRYKKNKTEH